MVKALLIHTILVCLAVALLISPSESGSPVVSAYYYPLDNGYRIELSIHNALSEFIWGIKVRDVVALDISGPSGWNIYQQSYIHYAVEWTTRDSAMWLLPGESLGGFAFTVESVKPSYVCYVATRSSGGNISISPVLIPEPASLPVLAMGLTGMVGTVMRRRR